MRRLSLIFAFHGLFVFCVVKFVAAAILLERNLSLDLNPKVIFFMLLGLSAIDECFDLLVGV